MSYVTSKDGTRIAYETVGSGRALILVDGALCFRNAGPMRPLSERLKSSFTVYLYDRRGRGESSDTLPYTPEREIEDIATLVEAAGGSANVVGVCTGGALALEAAVRIEGIEKLAIYDAPYITADSPDQEWDAKLEEYSRGPHGLALKLAYDIEIIDRHRNGKAIDPDAWASVKMPVLVLAGGKSPPHMRIAQTAIASALPKAEVETLDGETHRVRAEPLARTLLRFFGGNAGHTLQSLARAG